MDSTFETARKTKSSGVKSIAACLLLGGAFMGVSACVPLLLTAATVTVLDVSQDRRTAGTYLDDNKLEIRLRNDIAQDQSLTGINASVTAFNGIVLLTGEANSDVQRQRVSQLAETYKTSGEVRNVVNELKLAGKTNISSRINDTWITAKVKARLLKAKNLPASTVKVVTEHGKVYLLGQVTAIEAEAAVAAIHGIGGVTHIVKVFEYIE